MRCRGRAGGMGRNDGHGKGWRHLQGVPYFRVSEGCITVMGVGGQGGGKSTLTPPPFPCRVQSFTHLTSPPPHFPPCRVQSFTHLTYSKNKVVSAIQWLPHRKGVVAVACTEATSHAERVGQAGRPQYAYILVWNFKDPINPEYVLQVSDGLGGGRERRSVERVSRGEDVYRQPPPPIELHTLHFLLPHL